MTDILKKDIWKKQFRPGILLEGGTDWWSGRVRNVRVEGNRVTAEIWDQYIQTVRLQIKDGELFRNTCTCSSRTLCRHTAAVCFWLEENQLRSAQEKRMREEQEEADRAYEAAMKEYGRQKAEYDQEKKRAEEEGERRVQELKGRLERQGTPVPQSYLEEARKVSVQGKKPKVPQRLRVAQPPEVRDLISALSEEELRATLAEQAVADPKVMEWLELRSRKRVSADQLSKWKTQIERNTMEAIQAWRADRLQGGKRLSALYRKVSETVMQLMEAGQAEDAFTLICTVWAAGEGMDYFTEQGAQGAQDLEDFCYRQWVQIAASGTVEEQRNMILWLTRNSRKDEVCCMERVVADTAWHREILEERLKQARRRLDLYRKQVTMEQLVQAVRDAGKGIPLDEGMEILWLVPEILTILRRIGTEEQIQKLVREFHPLSTVRNWEIEDAAQRQDTNRCIALLEESLTLDAGLPRLEEQYAKRLIRAYEEAGRREDCRKMCRFLIFSCGGWGMESVEKLKKLTPPEEWGEDFRKIVELPQAKPLLFRLLAMEKEYSLLSDGLETRGTMEEVEYFEECLRSWDERRYRDVYREVLERYAADTRSPEQYPDLVNRLLKLRSMPEGRTIVREIARNWYVQYARRLGLIREMQRQGL